MGTQINEVHIYVYIAEVTLNVNLHSSGPLS